MRPTTEMAPKFLDLFSHLPDIGSSNVIDGSTTDDQTETTETGGN